tara:strand:+ start:1322 stop:1507 length:186 start_codon:yes stop_codon:yes gene_type:complete
MELGSILKSIKNIGSKDKGDDKEYSVNHVTRGTVLTTDISIEFEKKESDKKRPQCCSPTPR